MALHKIGQTQLLLSDVEVKKEIRPGKYLSNREKTYAFIYILQKCSACTI